jgi:hypothetical protein
MTRVYGPRPAGNGLTRLLLDDIAAVLPNVRAKDKVPSAALVAALLALTGRPWAAKGKRKPLTADAMASLLRPLGIAPKVLKIGGKPHRGYRVSAFACPQPRLGVPVTKERQAMAEDEVTPQKAAPTEEHVPIRAPVRLSARQISDLAVCYEAGAQAQHEVHDGNVDHVVLDRWLRIMLAGEVPPEAVEGEFGRVMALGVMEFVTRMREGEGPH